MWTYRSLIILFDLKSILNRLGPGLLYAGAAVGVSHLVQSTRAGASYGILMVIVVIAANLIKYPFFKAGPLYAAANKKSILDAFYLQGKWSMALFYLVTIGTMFAVQAAVTLITASVLASIFGWQLPLWQISAVILTLCGLLLLVGRYHLLDRIMKMVIILLTLTTVITLIASFFSSAASIAVHHDFDLSENADIFFLIALVGWMPAPLDISIWHSEWTLADQLDANQVKGKKESDFDFKVGYWGTTFLAAAFVALGAMILGGSGTELSSSGAVFAGQIINMYTSTLGDWSFLIVAIAAFTCMFSTTLTVLDAYPRVLRKAISLQYPKLEKASSFYNLLLLITILGALFVLIFQLDNMKQMVDFATSISFLTAPLLALLILIAARNSKEHVWSKLDYGIAYFGLAFLFCFSFYYLGIKFL